MSPSIQKIFILMTLGVNLCRNHLWRWWLDCWDLYLLIGAIFKCQNSDLSMRVIGFVVFPILVNETGWWHFIVGLTGCENTPMVTEPLSAIDSALPWPTLLQMVFNNLYFLTNQMLLPKKHFQEKFSRSTKRLFSGFSKCCALILKYFQNCCKKSLCGMRYVQSW